MIAERLKKKTALYHTKAEENNYSENIREGNITILQYANFLFRNYWLNFRVEQAYLRAETHLLPSFDYSPRLKAHLIRKDLENTGNKISTSAPEPFPELQPAEIIGAVYVTEGSTLGGNIIYKALSSNAVFKHKDVFNYLSYYKDNTSTMWKNFLQALESYYEQQPEKGDDIIEGAIKAYDYFIALSAHERSL